MKKILIAVALVVGWATASPAAEMINGAGATFPYPLYSKWFDEYSKLHPEFKFNYQSIGSGGGIRQLTERTVDFGASDAPMNEEQMKNAPGPVLHIPTVLGAVVITYNLPGTPPELKLTPEVVSQVFLGTITKWNDPKLASLNPGIKLPDQELLVVHRSDGSGTSYIFTDYLSSVSPQWAQKIGKGTSVNWPVGLGGKGNEGVTGQVKNTPGALGYVELAYARKNQLPVVSLQNKEGEFITPTIEGISAAAAGASANMPADLRVSLVNPPGKKAYPIAGFTYLLIYKDQPDEKKGRAMADFLWWAEHQGQKFAPELLYGPLPPEVIERAEKKIKEIQYQGKPLLTPQKPG